MLLAGSLTFTRSIRAGFACKAVTEQNQVLIDSAAAIYTGSAATGDTVCAVTADFFPCQSAFQKCRPCTLKKYKKFIKAVVDMSLCFRNSCFLAQCGRALCVVTTLLTVSKGSHLLKACDAQCHPELALAAVLHAATMHGAAWVSAQVVLWRCFITSQKPIEQQHVKGSILSSVLSQLLPL
jgi:hypothetical protein